MLDINYLKTYIMRFLTFQSFMEYNGLCLKSLIEESLHQLQIFTIVKSPISLLYNRYVIMIIFFQIVSTSQS
jgi:hypothetical protein